MEARFRRWFSRDKPRNALDTRLVAQPYESTIASQAPYKGYRPIAGNGPNTVGSLQEQNVGRRLSIEAAAPDVPRTRRHSDADRPRPTSRSSFRSLQLGSFGRRRSTSAAPTPAPSLFTWKYTRDPSLQNVTPTLINRDQVRSISAFAVSAPSSYTKSAHIDLLDAVSHVNPSREAFIKRIKASGKRDYGEDVADRNIADYGGVELESPYYSTSEHHNKAHYSLENATQTAGMRGSWRYQHWDGPARGYITRFGSDGAGDDTQSRDQYSANSTYSHENQYVASYTKPKSAIAPTGQLNGNADYNLNARSSRPRVSSTKSTLGSVNPKPTVIAAPRSSSITPGRTRIVPRRLNDSEIMSTPQPPATSGSRRLRKSRPSTENKSAAVSAALAAASASSRRLAHERQVNTTSLTERVMSSPAQNRSPVLQMTPTNSESPTISIPRASLDKALPPDPRTHSRNQSANYSTYRRQEPFQETNDRPRVSLTSSDDEDAAMPPNINKRSSRVFDEPTKSQPLKDVMGLSNTTDTEVIEHQRPAVVHEHVTPRVHEIKEECITREIHNYDVFHRIQPIIDVEVLPTRHYIPNPNGNGLIEVPASAVPGRHTSWEVKPVEKGRASVASTQPVQQVTSTNRPRSRAPSLVSQKKSVTDNGIQREEKVWRHSAQLENGGREAGQTVPIHLEYADSDISDEYMDARERHSVPVDGEELLFRDSERAFGGQLPGLDDPNPIIDGIAPMSKSSTTNQPSRTSNENEVEATEALKRRQAEMTQQMAAMNVAES